MKMSATSTVILAAVIGGALANSVDDGLTAASDGYRANQGRLFGQIASHDSWLDITRHHYYTDDNYRLFVTAVMQTWWGMSVSEDEINDEQNRTFHGDNEMVKVLAKDRFLSGMHGTITSRNHERNRGSQQAIKFYNGLLSTTSTTTVGPLVNFGSGSSLNSEEFGEATVEENGYEFDL